MYSTEPDQCFNAIIGRFIYLFQAVKGQHPILPIYGNDVCSDGRGDQVQVLQGLFVSQTQAQAEGCDQLEAYPAAAQLLIGVKTPLLLGIEDGYSRRQLSIRQVMVAHDEVDLQGGCISDKIHRFDAAVEGNDQRKPIIPGKINTLPGDAIAFPVSMRDVKNRSDLAHSPYGGTGKGQATAVVPSTS